VEKDQKDENSNKKRSRKYFGYREFGYIVRNCRVKKEKEDITMVFQ